MPVKAEGRRLRRGRHSETGRIYLVTSVCHQRRKVFTDWRSGRCAVQAMMAVSDWADTFCYVIMPDHVHWLMRLKTHQGLSSAVQKFKSLTTRRLRDRQIQGCIWQRGFHDHALRADEDLVAVARYVVANPLRAGLVRSVGDYALWDAVWL